MKKTLFFMILAFSISQMLNAQITLTQSNTNFTIGTIIAKGADTTGFVIPGEGVNKQWNYAGLVQTNSTTWDYTTPSNSNFPNATFTESNNSATFVPGRYYYFDSYFQNAVSGVNMLGFTVKNQRYGIGDLTMNSLDSCIFIDQFYVYSSNAYLTPFPVTMNTSWYTTLRSFVKFDLTINAYALNHAPCQKVTNTYRLDTIVGWGKLRVPTANGVSLAYDVLMLKRIVIQKDSFYMSGSPAPSALLTAFGLSQGQTTTTNRYVFFRENARYNLMLINFGSNNFTKASSVYYDGTATTDYTGIADINDASEINIYPNPCSGSFILQTESFKNNPFEINIINIIGQQVYKQQFNQIQTNTLQINTEMFKPGIYYVNIISDRKKCHTKLVVE